MAKLNVKDAVRTCSTRERGREFYQRLADWLESLPPWEEAVLSFEGVDFVSPSFLDETLIRLAQERPPLLRRLLIRALPAVAVEKLRKYLKVRLVQREVEQVTESELKIA